MGIDLFQTGDPVAFSLEPPDLLFRHIRIDDNATLGLAIPDDDDTELRSEGAQVAAIAPRDGDVVESHRFVFCGARVKGGGEGGIRTHVGRNAPIAFRVRAVVTASVPLRDQRRNGR